jgi:hypothetical protein
MWVLDFYIKTTIRSVFALGLAMLLACRGNAEGTSSEMSFSRPDTTTAADSVVTFNEIMYNPGEGATAVEWVELFNATSIDIELSGWRIEGGIQYRFPTNTILPAFAYAVVASDPDALRAGTGATNVFGPFTGRLADEGERLRLRNHNNRILDEMTYGDEAPWPMAADGSGASLAKRHPYDASSPAANWSASAQFGGTPGRSNFPETDPSLPMVVNLIGVATAGRWRVPDAAAFGQSWTVPNFDDSTWTPGAAALGFDTRAASTQTPDASLAFSFEGDVTDVTGRGLDGQNLGVQFSTNVPPAIGGGKSAQFDGLASQVQVKVTDNPSAYTLALWVSVDTVRPCSLLVRTDASGPMTSWSHQLRINSNNQFEHYVWDGNLRTVAATNIVRPGVWYHVAATASDNGPMSLYVNGVASGTRVDIGTLWGGGTQWQFGTDSGHTPNFFQGRLDEAGIWDAVLDPEEIARLAAGTSPALLNGYRHLIVTDAQSSLFGVNSSMLVRLPFNLSSGMALDRLTLTVRYDDGFAAYLNGGEVARRNASKTLFWNSTSDTKRSAEAACRAETIDLSPWIGRLSPGSNVLAFQALNASASDPNFLLAAELTAIESPIAAGQADIAFNELAAAPSHAFFIELANHGTSDVSLAGMSIKSSQGPAFVFGPGSLGSGQFLTLGTSELGFSVRAGDKLFLLGAALNAIDAVKAADRLQGRRDPGGPWLFPSEPTPGAANRFALHDEIVINEILYRHAPYYRTNTIPPTMEKNNEQWVELYNRSGTAIDLGGWRLADAMTFTFPSNTILAADAYLVVANHAGSLRAQYPDISVLGDFLGSLSHRGARVLLLDAQGNPAHEVVYYAGFPWPDYADGGGSSLELRDPRADASAPESWAASREESKARWQHYAYRARAVNPIYSPSLNGFNEFRLGLLAPGEALLDNITVLELPANSTPRQLLQNTGFSAGAAHWRIAGNHGHSSVKSDPETPGNSVLHLVATGPMSYLENQLETTLKANGVIVPVVAGRDYEIAFDAKWLAGSPQLHTELYYNKVAATTLLERPDKAGTPGRRNSTFISNIGPSYHSLRHSPVLPASSDPIAVSVRATDPDGIASLKLRYAVNGAAWQSMPMAASAFDIGFFSATIPAQASGSVIQFYLEGADSVGMTSAYPPGGANSRALIKVGAPQLLADKQTFRTILTPSDAELLHSFVNLMSDDLLGCTVVHNEREVYYNARIRLHGSMFSRPDAATAGLRIEFPADRLFRGSLPSVIVRRSDLVETIGHHILNQAGGLPCGYCDVVHLVSHRPDNVGAATLHLANYDRTYVDSQFENDNDGTLFKLEGIRVFQATDDGTPEGRKLPQPVDFVWNYDISNLGDNPEQYRWSLMIQNQRARDDYSRIIAMGKAFSLTGSALRQAADTVIDADEWARYFALQTLMGVGDIYGVDNPHNIAFYARPSDGRVVVLQNDWGFSWALPANASIYGKNKIYDILRLPVYRRLYQGHLLDLIDSTYNSAHLTRWAQHFSRITGANFNGAAAYADARGAAVRSQLAAKTAFAITSNGGRDFTVAASSATLQGQGWIDVRDIGLGIQTNMLPIAWLDDQRWQITVPLQPGTNNVQLSAYDYRGGTVGHASIQIATSASGLAQRDCLRIAELMYHPQPPTSAEAAAGFTSDEDFEFIELVNTGPAGVSLLGVRFTGGVAFDFSAAAITNLDAGQRVLVVANKPAFTFRYGIGLPIAGTFVGHLSNGGEFLRLADAWGGVIQEFEYRPDNGWPVSADGQGSSLEALDMSADYSNPMIWQASALAGGTPGRRAIVRPSFVGILLDGAQVRLRFIAAPEQTYTIEWRESLSIGSWKALKTFPASAAARLEEVADELQQGRSQRAYRLSTP